MNYLYLDVLYIIDLISFSDRRNCFPQFSHACSVFDFKEKENVVANSFKYNVVNKSNIKGFVLEVYTLRNLVLRKIQQYVAKYEYMNGNILVSIQR